ncbi:MAG TPA: ISNCY family transposase [Gemmatimonadaceae bacterium]|nr:ISNCY family transposase [Gemmatimonadaceae bacterium]
MALSDRDLVRVLVIRRVINGELETREAGELLCLGARQIKRLTRRFRQSGAKGLVHGNYGRRSNHTRPAAERERVIKLIRERYAGCAEVGPGQRFGPTLLSEHLAEDEGMFVPVSTLTDWMRAEGLWSRRRKRKPHRRRRDRKEHFGEMVQLDGSFHDWLEGRGPVGCLMTMTDDATSTMMGWLGEEETFWDSIKVLKRWIAKYGVPRALYTDWKTLYRSPCPSQPIEATQFGRVCARLGIELIQASSPQAKGRVERSHGTNQDRLIKKLRLKGISTHAEVNEYLETIYLRAHNARFARRPRSSTDYHLPLRRSLDTSDTWCHEEKRRVSLDGVISYKSRLFSLKLRRDMPDRASVFVRTSEDGCLRVVYRSREGAEYLLPSTEHIAAPCVAGELRGRAPWSEAQRPRKNHPWRLRAGMEVAEAMKAKRDLQIQPPPG